MNRLIQHSRHLGLKRQRGFSLIELMVAVLIGLFLTLGLSKIFLSMYSTSQSQGTMFQFQTNQRQAISALVNTVQLAGYFASTPTSNTANTSALPGTTNTGDSSVFTAGAGIVGTTGNGSPEQDTINIQFQSQGTDNVYNCQGGLTTAGSYTVVVNSFSVNSSNQLVCTVSVAGGTPTTPLVLANNVKNMTILYAVDTTMTSGNPLNYAFTSNNFMTAKNINTAGAPYWGYIRAVQITLNFCTDNVINPASTSCSTTTPWVQTINLMGRS